MNIFNASLSRGKKPFLFIFNGESNSVGYALNSMAPLGELGVRDGVTILNNNSLVFEVLNIGLNNSGISAERHGFELEIANKVDVKPLLKNVHIIKTGQGGSTVAQWNIGGSYMNTFTIRVNTAKTLIDFSEYNVVILYSLGLNDSVSGTDVEVWKTSITEIFGNLRDIIDYGDIPIIMTEFQGLGAGGIQFDDYTVAIQEIAATLDNVYSVDTTSATLMDTSHWDYSGYKFVTNLLIDKAVSAV